jgi:predicted transcriptional regulator
MSRPSYSSLISSEFVDGLVKAIFGSQVRPYAVQYLLNNGKSKSGDISKNLGRSQAAIETSLRPLVIERVLTIDPGTKEYDFNGKLGPEVFRLAQYITQTLRTIEEHAKIFDEKSRM